MNLGLLDFTNAGFPDRLDSELDIDEEDEACCVRFSRTGSYLGVGYGSGSVVIWDFTTRGVAVVVEAHGTGPVAAVGFSRHGDVLMTAGSDGNVRLWDLSLPASAKLLRQVNAGSAVEAAQLKRQRLPDGGREALACLADGRAVSIDFAKGTVRPLALQAAGASSNTAINAGSLGAVSSEGASGGSKKACCPEVTALSVAYSHKAEFVYVGTSDGHVLQYAAQDLRAIGSHRATGCPQVREIVPSRDGRWLLYHACDKVIRLVSVGTDGALDVGGGSAGGSGGGSASGSGVGNHREFQDAVNRVKWRCCCFSGDSEYVMGGTSWEYQYILYIWTVEGHLVQKIDGPQEGLLALAWHPVRPFVAAATMEGQVQIWGTDHNANWTAFAPDFEELDENVEYMEAEDEFDEVLVQTESGEWVRRPVRDKAPAHNEDDGGDVSVDIMAPVQVAAFSSDSESDGGDAFYIPCAHSAPIARK